MGFTIGMALKVTILCSASLERLPPCVRPGVAHAQLTFRKPTCRAAPSHRRPGLAMKVLPAKAVVATALWKSHHPPSKYILCGEDD